MMHNLINVPSINDKNSTLSNEMYLIELEVVGGRSQYAQVTKEQAIALGVQFPAEESPKEQIITEVPSTDINTPINVHLFNGQVKKAKNNSVKFNYKIVLPEDVNLKQKNGPPRGRPKKPKSSNEEPPPVPTKVVKTSRTRSGRITRPPTHMEKDFKKIVTDEDKYEASRNNKAVSTTEFTPLKTNEGPISVPALINITEKKKKGFIPAQYRCHTCQKAFLGRSRMTVHLKKYPDHGLPAQLNLVDCEVWNFLIDVTLKSKEGTKGRKFCSELLNLIKNARILVKYFFKRGQPDYYIDPVLSSVLEVEEGHYRFNENDICKDVSIFSFLEYIDTYNDKNNPKAASEIDDVLDILKPHIDEKKSNANLDDNMPIVDKNNFENLFDCNNFYEPDKKIDNGSRPCENTIYGLPSNFVSTENIIGFEFEPKLDKSNKNYFEPKETKQDYEIIDHNMEILKIKTGNDEKVIEDEKNHKKIEEFDLRKLHLLGEEELILPDNNILDTSTNSDDIMNVDQFVNERFKKLTESDDLQNTSLSLDLPPLECFDFHTN